MYKVMIYDDYYGSEAYDVIGYNFDTEEEIENYVTENYDVANLTPSVMEDGNTTWYTFCDRNEMELVIEVEKLTE